jgi:acetoin utilization deacetylase AcuC-like enzyme
MSLPTALLTDERCFWHGGGGNYAFMLPAGGFVQPGAGLPESPESKRRLLNLVQVSGLASELEVTSAPIAQEQDLLRVHTPGYIKNFRSLSASTGGELGPRAPFGPGGFEIASVSAGLAIGAVTGVLAGRWTNAYALTRPPGHHALPDRPAGFCLLANIAIAIEAARAQGLARRFAVVDWDVHPGNGTEAIFLGRDDVLTISIHQDRCYPNYTSGVDNRGSGQGLGANLNIPLPPGTGHRGYLAAMHRLVVPQLLRFRPDVLIVACGFDASGFDPLGRMMATANTFKELTAAVQQTAQEVCGGRLVLVHEGGYSDMYVPFCGHAVLEQLAGSKVHVPDPLAHTLESRQPDSRFDAFVNGWLDEIAEALVTSA